MSIHNLTLPQNLNTLLVTLDQAIKTPLTKLGLVLSDVRLEYDELSCDVTLSIAVSSTNNGTTPAMEILYRHLSEFNLTIDDLKAVKNTININDWSCQILGMQENKSNRCILILLDGNKYLITPALLHAAIKKQKIIRFNMKEFLNSSNNQPSINTEPIADDEICEAFQPRPADPDQIFVDGEPEPLPARPTFTLRPLTQESEVPAIPASEVPVITAGTIRPLSTTAARSAENFYEDFVRNHNIRVNYTAPRSIDENSTDR